MLSINTNIELYSELDYIINIIKPDNIIHLAALSNLEDCENNLIKCITLNGMVICNIIDIIIKNKINCKLFNASSSELYKGHNNYVIQEDDINKYPISLYSIAKDMGHNIINHYIKKYNNLFFNGIIFMTESRLRKNNFLLKKVAEHAKGWHSNKNILTLGSLESFRNINHAEDVAEAIYIILQQSKGGTYLICGNNNYKVEDIVINLYKKCNIELIKHNNTYIDNITKNVVLNITNNIRDMTTNISGNPNKLYKLGWKPKYNMDDIIDDILNI